VKIKEFDKATVETFSKELVAFLEPFARERGLTVKSTGGKFDAGTFTKRLLFTVKDPGRVNFEKYAHRFKLSPEDFGRVVKIDDEEYRLVGITTGSKYAIDAERVSDGKAMAYTAWAIREALREEVPSI
jgi:hypothetical protein